MCIRDSTRSDAEGPAEHGEGIQSRTTRRVEQEGPPGRRRVMVRWFASESALRFADLPPALANACRDLMQAGTDDVGFGASSTVCLLASEVVEGRAVPTWIDSETRFLVVLDIPLGACLLYTSP